MLRELRNRNLETNLIIIFFIYFTTKMYWDMLIPTIFEFLFIGIILIGLALFFVNIQFYSGKHTIKLLLLYLLYVMWIIFNGLYQSDTEQLARAMYEYVFYSSIFFSMAYFFMHTNINKVAKIICIVGFIVSLLSWYEYFSHTYLIGNFDATLNNAEGYGFRAAVFSRSYLTHGVILGFFSLITFYLHYVTNRKIYLGIAGFCYISILSTASRGPLVSFGVGIIIIYLFHIYSKKNKKSTVMILWLIPFLLVIIGILLFSDFQTSNEIVNYFLDRIRSIFDWEGDAGNVGRQIIWDNTFNKIHENFWVGIGPSKTGSWGTGAIGVTESGLLKRLLELGIVGFLLHYSFIFIIIKRSIKNFKKLNQAYKLKFIFFAALFASIFIHDIVLQATEEIMVSFFMWSALAGIYIIPYKHRHQFNNVKI